MLIVTKGEREGISGGKGEGFAGTIIKGTWTITRRVETGEGGREDWWGLGGVG